MAKFIAKGAVKYNGKNYASGETIEVKKEDVKEFKAFGWEIIGEQEEKDEDQKDEEQVKLTANSKKDLIIAELVKRGIEHDPAKNKAELFALLA